MWKTSRAGLIWKEIYVWEKGRKKQNEALSGAVGQSCGQTIHHGAAVKTTVHPGILPPGLKVLLVKGSLVNSCRSYS